MKYSEYLVDKCNELTPQKVCKGNSHTEFVNSLLESTSFLNEINEECNPYNNKTALELYNKTKERENVIINLGYKLITIWENDFNKLRI